MKMNKRSVLRMALAACVLAGSMGLSAGVTYADSGRGGNEQRQENRQEDRQNDDGNRGRGSDGSSQNSLPPSADRSNDSSDDAQPRQEDRREDRQEDRREDRRDDRPPAPPITVTLPVTSPISALRPGDDSGRGRGHDDSPSQPVSSTMPVSVPVEVRGILLSAPASLTGMVQVNGVNYTLTPTTRIRQPQGALTAGACVQVKYVVQNGVNVAVAIKTVNRNAARCTGN